MVIFNLKFVEAVATKNTKPHWYFCLVIQAGAGTLSLPGWRYYPETDYVKPPQRRIGAKHVPALTVDKAANESIRRLVKEALALQVVELDSVLARLSEMSDEDRAARLEELRVDSYAGAALVWTWMKGQN